jgi:chromosome segregation ATPase
MMDFGSFMRRGKTPDATFDDLQASIASAVEQIMVELDAAPETDPLQADEAALQDDLAASASSPDLGAHTAATVPDGEFSASEMTQHTQGRLKALDTFEDLYDGAQEHLDTISAKLAEIGAVHRSVRELIAVLNSEIRRGNELELANVALLAEHRKLWEQFQDSSRKHQTRESLIEHLQQREIALIQEGETLRVALAAARVEITEVANSNATNETELGDLSKALAARTTELERRTQESDALRERTVSLSLELDKALKAEVAARYKLEEISEIHGNELQRNAELLAALSKSEMDALKVQKALDAAQTKRAELDERVRDMEAERGDEMRRALAGKDALQAELDATKARLETALQQSGAMTDEVADLKSRLRDAVAAKHVADETLAALTLQSESDRNSLSAANASLSQLTLQQASDQIQLDVRIQECEDLKGEIAALNKRVRELLPFERLHRVTMARERDAAPPVIEFPGGTPAETGARNAGRRPGTPTRRRAV